MKKRTPKKKGPSDAEIKTALTKIAGLGSGISTAHIDWENIGKNAVHLAKETLREKCVECGK